MIVIKITSALIALSIVRICFAATTSSASSSSTTGYISSSTTKSEDTLTSAANNLGLRTVLRVYDDCQKSDSGFSLCLKRKAITFIDRVTNLDVLNVGDGVKVIRSDFNDSPTNNKTTKSRSSSSSSSQSSNILDNLEWEKSLPRGLEARDEAMSNVLVDKVAHLLSERTIKITMPSVSSAEIGRAIEEGRGKMKKMMGMMMMGMAMKMVAMVPVAIAGLYVLAGKALIISKIALLLAGIIGIKKLLSSKQSGGGGGSSSGYSSGGSSGGGWQSSGGGGGGGGGWDRRSNDGQTMAYKAYVSQ